MDKSLSKLFETIDNMDADENIKLFYKDLLAFESRDMSLRYKDEYKKLIKLYMEDI